MGGMFGVTPEDGIPPDPSPSNNGEAGTPPQPEPDKGTPPEPAPEPAREEPPPPPPAPSKEPAKEEPSPPPGPPIDEEEREYLAGENEDGFVLGQRKYKSLEAADHVFRRFGGRAHAAEQRARELAEENRRLSETLVQYQTRPPTEAPPGAPAEPAPAPSTPQRLTDLVKPEEFDELIAEHGPGAAYARVAELVEDRMGQVLEERMAPLQPLVNRSQGVDVATQVFDSMSAMTREDGLPVYPELDPDKPESDAVVGIWTEMLTEPGFEEIALTPHGVRAAVQEYRLRQASSQPSTSPPEPATTERGQAIQDMGRGTRGVTPTTPGPTRIQMTPAQLEEAARKAVSDRVDPVFGVTRER